MRDSPSIGLPRLSSDDRSFLLRVARRALAAHLEGSPPPRLEHGSAVLCQEFATFVTLRTAAAGELRGCRGETTARQALVDSVATMAVASAVGDPRFEPVTRAEVDDLSIEISVLGTMSPIRPADVEVGRHGLMVVLGPRVGLLLPSVPESCGWDRQQFLAGLCLKAGLPETAWHETGVELFGFETLSWGDRGSG